MNSLTNKKNRLIPGTYNNGEYTPLPGLQYGINKKSFEENFNIGSGANYGFSPNPGAYNNSENRIYNNLEHSRMSDFVSNILPKISYDKDVEPEMIFLELPDNYASLFIKNINYISKNFGSKITSQIINNIPNRMLYTYNDNSKHIFNSISSLLKEGYIISSIIIKTEKSEKNNLVENAIITFHHQSREDITNNYIYSIPVLFSNKTVIISIPLENTVEKYTNNSKKEKYNFIKVLFLIFLIFLILYRLK